MATLRLFKCAKCNNWRAYSRGNHARHEQEAFWYLRYSAWSRANLEATAREDGNEIGPDLAECPDCRLMREFVPLSVAMEGE